ncbi:MAG: sulfite exporter TauE/SafE family protein [Acidimicrobiales bacterium]|nr:sulfite exporter TauE/SafE family protein [Acidimicrobiales bacterium]
MEWWEAALLLAGGAAAGVINAMAGGGSMLTVPLLVLAGVPGNSANGSNRVGILTSNVAAAVRFRRLGVRGMAHIAPVIGPALAGSLVGSLAISRLTDDTFETVFGLLMIPLVLLTINKPRVRVTGDAWPAGVTIAVFFLVGVYGGAIQAGVGLVMLAALSRAGFDLVTANHIKVLVTLAVTCVALPVFIAQGQIEWGPAVLLAVGLTAGGWVGARLTVEGGDVWIRRVMVAAALALAAKLLGVYGWIGDWF